MVSCWRSCSASWTRSRCARLVVNAGGLVKQAQGFPELFVWETLHSNEYNGRGRRRHSNRRHAAQDRSIRED